MLFEKLRILFNHPVEDYDEKADKFINIIIRHGEYLGVDNCYTDNHVFKLDDDIVVLRYCCISATFIRAYMYFYREENGENKRVDIKTIYFQVRPSKMATIKLLEKINNSVNVNVKINMETLSIHNPEELIDVLIREYEYKPTIEEFASMH